MAKCGYCGSMILIGGVRAGEQRFCNQRCLQSAQILSLAKTIPSVDLDRKVEEVWRGNCPQCQGLGPVDIHQVHDVWSALVLTRWTTKSQVSCRSCATRRQWGGVAFSFFFGWWGFPWGLILTPVQITRNVVGISRGPNPSEPSPALKKHVQVKLGAAMLAHQKAATTPPLSAN